MNSIRGGLATLLAVGLISTACSGGDDAGTTTTSPPTTESSPPTTSPPSPPTTEPPASTSPTAPDTTIGAPPTTAPPTTALPPTTEPPPTSAPDPDLEQVRAAVSDALVASWEKFDQIVRNPLTPGGLQILMEAMTEEEARLVIDRFVVFYVQNDLAERTNPELPATIIPYPETLLYDAAAGTAEMEFCFISTNLLVQIQEDGSEELQDDDVGVIHGSDTFVLFDGRWLDSGGRTFEVQEGQTKCAER